MESKLTFEQFTYWLQGYFEISGSKELNHIQVQIIKDHLDLVFNKVTPVRIPELKFEDSKTDSHDIPSKPTFTPPFTPRNPGIFQPTGSCILCGKNHHGQMCPSSLIAVC